jgi:hypothetical protein
MIDWDVEWPEILLACAQRGSLDPCLVAAIRVAEGGRPGREYGVLSVSAPDRESQLRVCTRTLLTYLSEFGGNPYRLIEAQGKKRLVVTAAFLAYARDRYCPVDAENDPTHLNENWYANVSKTYYDLVQQGGPM